MAAVWGWPRGGRPAGPPPAAAIKSGVRGQRRSVCAGSGGGPAAPGPGCSRWAGPCPQPPAQRRPLPLLQPSLCSEVVTNGAKSRSERRRGGDSAGTGTGSSSAPRRGPASDRLPRPTEGGPRLPSVAQLAADPPRSGRVWCRRPSLWRAGAGCRLTPALPAGAGGAAAGGGRVPGQGRARGAGRGSARSIAPGVGVGAGAGAGGVLATWLRAGRAAPRRDTEAG